MVEDLIKRLRDDAGLDGQKLLAADLLEQQAARIAELTTCKLCNSTGNSTPCAYPTEINRQQARRITALESERDALVNSVAAGGKGAVAPDGWKLVPCHPDTAMKWAGALINNQGFDFAHATYAAMLDASPTAALENRDGRDAERYRHLRECNSGSLVIVQIIGTGDDDQIVLTEEDADAAIDAAMESDHE